MDFKTFYYFVATTIIVACFGILFVGSPQGNSGPAELVVQMVPKQNQAPHLKPIDPKHLPGPLIPQQSGPKGVEI